MEMSDREAAKQLERIKSLIEEDRDTAERCIDIDHADWLIEQLGAKDAEIERLRTTDPNTVTITISREAAVDLADTSTYSRWQSNQELRDAINDAVAALEGGS